MTEPEKITTPEEAFNRAAAGYEFRNQKLKPFSAVRQAAASAMGLRFGLVDDQDIFTVSVDDLKEGKKKDIQFYNQMFADVVTVMWLCTVPDSRVLRALRKTDESRAESFKWADDNGITLTSERYYEAASVFFQMMQDITVSTAVPEDPAEEADPAYAPNE